MNSAAQSSFTIILHAGNAKSLVMEALRESRLGNGELAVAKIKEANQELVLAHKAQTELLQEEAQGENVPYSIILVHAQDHLMNAITVRDLAEEIIKLKQSL